MSEISLQELLIGAFIGGGIIGAIPFFIGLRNSMEKLGAAGFLMCMAGSFVGGVVFSVPIAIVFSTIILYRVKNEKK